MSEHQGHVVDGDAVITIHRTDRVLVLEMHDSSPVVMPDDRFAEIVLVAEVVLVAHEPSLLDEEVVDDAGQLLMRDHAIGANGEARFEAMVADQDSFSMAEDLLGTISMDELDRPVVLDDVESLSDREERSD